jgi:hypothetical protein
VLGVALEDLHVAPGAGPLVIVVAGVAAAVTALAGLLPEDRVYLLRRLAGELGRL